MNNRDWAWVGCVVLATVIGSMGAGSPAAWASEPVEKVPESPGQPALPAPLSGFSDEGVFHIYKNENRFATNSFKWRKDGAFEGRTAVSVGDRTAESGLTITPGKDGRWSSMSMKTPLGPVEIERDGGMARVTFREKTKTVALEPDAMLFENLSPALMSQALRAYDKAKGGKQSFPLFILPRMVQKGSLEFKDTVKRVVDGGERTFTRYTYAVPGVDMIVWVDKVGKLYLAEVPAQQAAYVREGYEALRQAGESKPPQSSATPELKEER